MPTIQPDFLSTVPPVLTLALVQLAPFVAAVRKFLQLSSWSTGNWYHSWLVLAAWWAICVLLKPTLPLLGAAAYLLVQRYHRPQKEPLTTDQDLQTLINDLTVIQSLLPHIVLPPADPKPLLRAAAVLWIPYVLILRLASFGTLLAIIGSVIFTWRAPWAVIIRSVVWRSAYFRWTVYKTWATISGRPLPVPTHSVQATSASEDGPPVQSLRYLFTIYENQRWWMGLDWTAALLPGERPSWCTLSQAPVSPPNAFNLPSNTTIYVPDGKGGRLKRTAIWKWEEPEWRVVIHKEGATPARVERPLPTIKEDGSSGGSRLAKAAGLLRESGITETPKPSETADDGKRATGAEQLTDPDGWVFADNKWENPSNKGGMGKYTRCRRWTRIAVVFEVVEPVEPGQLGLEREGVAPPTPTKAVTPDAPGQDTPTVATTMTTDVPPDSISIDTVGNPPDSPLRQRLKMALRQNSTPVNQS